MVQYIQGERFWHSTSSAILGQKEETKRLAEWRHVDNNKISHQFTYKP